MPGILTDSEFAAKVDYEGGLDEALLGYGLSSTDLIDQDGELFKALSEYEDWLITGNPLRARVLAAMPDEWDEDY